MAIVATSYNFVLSTNNVGDAMAIITPYSPAYVMTSINGPDADITAGTGTIG